MGIFNEAAEGLLTSGPGAHLVTLNEDGTPQVTMVWITLDGDDILISHMAMRKKIRNMLRNPHVAVSVQGVRYSGVDQYLVAEGTATVTKGESPELIATLRKAYLGEEPPASRPEAPENPGSPNGYVTRIHVTKVGGNGPW